MCLPQVFRKSFSKLFANPRAVRILLGPPVVILQLLPNSPFRLLYLVKILLIGAGILCIPRKDGSYPWTRKYHGYAMKLMASIMLLELILVVRVAQYS